MKKVGNRKTTKGRHVYYQVITYVTKEGNEVSKTIKHVQETSKKLKAAEGMVKFHELKNKPTKPSERTLSKKKQRNRKRLVWNKGTYIKSLHGELK